LTKKRSSDEEDCNSQTLK